MDAKQTAVDKTEGVVKCRAPDIMSDDRIFLAWQRSHMANERTFLAWARTSISMLAFGFVIERFDIFLRHLLALSEGTIKTPPSKHIMYLSLFSFLLGWIHYTLFRCAICQREASH